MGKRIKPSSLLQDNAAEASIIASEQNAACESAVLGGNMLDSKLQEKLDKYDAMEMAVAGLTAENQELKDKAAEYAEKLEKLNDASSKISKLTTEIEILKKQLEASKADSNTSEVAVLKKECKELRDEADKYLVKISELTFENANLTCQLNELDKKSAANGKISNQKQFGPNTNQSNTYGSLAQPYRDVYNPYKNNGYGTW